VLPQHFWYNENKRIEKIMVRQIKTKEEKFAEIVSNHIADLRFDLEFAGRYLAWTSSLTYRRLLIVLEAMKAEREKEDDRDSISR
jgi:hypothetical protein